MSGPFRPISEKTHGELLLERMLSQTKVDIRKWEDESIILKERLASLYMRKSDLDFLLETVIEDSLPDDGEDTPIDRLNASPSIGEG